MSIAIVFPGQGSQSVGMLSGLAAEQPAIIETFAEASDALGYDMWSLVQSGPPEALNATERTQPIMLTAGIAVYRAWRARSGPEPGVLAGHSLGEYTALVAAGSLSFADAVALVAERGRLMQAAVAGGEGAIAAVLGLDDAAVEDLCRDCAEDQVLSCANYNAPGQVVIAGARAAVERAVALAGERGASRAVPLPVSVPVHCALMKPAEDALAERLQATDIKATPLPVVHNYDASIRGDADGIRDALRKQLSQPVRWVRCIEVMAGQGARQFVELGPGRVLAGLMRRIDRGLQAYGVHDAASLEKALEHCAD